MTRNEELLEAYQRIRHAISEFEIILHAPNALLDENESKLADKSIVVMKVGAKLLKKMLRRRGIKGRLKA